MLPDAMLNLPKHKLPDIPPPAVRLLLLRSARRTLQDEQKAVELLHFTHSEQKANLLAPLLRAIASVNAYLDSQDDELEDGAPVGETLGRAKK